MSKPFDKLNEEFERLVKKLINENIVEFQGEEIWREESLRRIRLQHMTPEIFKKITGASKEQFESIESENYREKHTKIKKNVVVLLSIFLSNSKEDAIELIKLFGRINLNFGNESLKIKDRLYAIKVWCLLEHYDELKMYIHQESYVKYRTFASKYLSYKFVIINMLQ